MKFHTGDTVIVISGKDKGKTGSIMRVLDSEQKVVIEGINIRTRHIAKNAQQAGRIVKYEASLNACKVMLVDPKTGKPSRIGYQMKDGKKIRISKLSGEVVKKGKMPAKKKDTKDAKASKAAKTSEASEAAPASAASEGGAKKPFWQKMKFGSSAIDADTSDTGRSTDDQSVPKQQSITHRSGGRGS